MADAAAADDAEAQAPQEVVFHIEVLGASGLPKPELTLLQFSGFGIGGTLSSLPAEAESSEPCGWLFPPQDSGKAASPSTPSPGAGEDAAGEPEALCRFSQPCGSSDEKQLVLDSVCAPLHLALVRSAEPAMTLATASLELKELIHDTSSVEVTAELDWSEEFLTEIRTAFEERVAAKAAAAEEAAAAPAEGGSAEGGSGGDEGGGGEGNEAGDASAEEAPKQRESFAEPASGKVRVRVSTAGPIGRVLCPEDLQDWTVVTVRLDGCYRLPQKLLEIAGPLPQDSPGIVADHPLSYSLRVLGCHFNGGKLVMPQVERPPDGEAGAGQGGEGGGAAAANPAREGSPEGSGEAAGAEEGDGTALEQALPVPEFTCDIGREEFLEGLTHAGWVAAQEDGPAVFDFLMRPRTGMGETIGRQEFARLEELGVPAEPASLLALRTFLLEKCGGQLSDAFGMLDEGAEGLLSREAFQAGLERLGFPSLEEVESLFVALDTQRVGTVSREDLGTLDVYKNMHDLRIGEKVKDWLLDCCGSVQSLTQQLDEGKTGVVTSEGWKAAVERLGYPSAEESGILLQLLAGSGTNMDAGAGEGSPEPEQPSLCLADLEALPALGSEAAQKALLSLEELIAGSRGADAATDAFASLCGDVADGGEGDGTQGLNFGAFQAACARLSFAPPGGLRWVFALLRERGSERIAAAEVAALLRYNAAARFRRLAGCRAFILSAFGSVSAAFQLLFDDRSEAMAEAEAMQPRIEWPQASVRGYRGRAWLQQLLNSLRDDRGRLCAGDGEVANGGSWIYFFPCLAGQDSAADFKEIPDAGQAGLARAARWHHAQGFVGLRRLSAPSNAASGGPELEFRAFLLQGGAQPTGVNEAGDLPTTPFTAFQTYVKGVISLDRPLERLCPRNIRPLPDIGGQPLMPPAPEGTPPPTVVEELELDARRIVGKLAIEFARMCKEKGLEEPQIVGKGAQEGAQVLLGHKGLPPHAFIQWLKEDGEVLPDLAAELRPAIVRMVRSEVKDGPSCGLSGNENDARYSGIRDLILKHLFRALNQDVDLHKRRRDALLWRGASLQGSADDGDPSCAKPGELAARQQQKDKALRRLVFEYELLGEHVHATRTFDSLLELPGNVDDGANWCSYARFLMRCGQRQPQALDALRRGISLRPEEEGPSLEEAAFLACMLQNHALPCASQGPEPTPAARFEAARSVLEGYADRHPAERLPLYFLFAVHALEAYAVQAEAESAAADAEASADHDLGLSLKAAQASAQALRAQAMKYLELARTAPQIFRGTLSKPQFSELEALSRKEKLNRGEITEAPPCPKIPPAWEPEPQPAFVAEEEVHRCPDEEDAVALQCIDLMLHFGVPSFVRFLVKDAPEAYGFLSQKSASSEKCRLQLIKAAALSCDWDDAIAQIHDLFSSATDRLREAWILLGESHYRKAKAIGATGSASFAEALQAYEEVLNFFDKVEGGGEGSPPTKKTLVDPVIHLRVASIYYMRAEESAFADSEAMALAVEHYTRSLEIAQTAEAWRNAGVCKYRQARLLGNDFENPELVNKRQGLLRDAVRFLSEANLLDNSRPQVNAWLAICSVELGLAQVAKQTLRQVLRCEEHLDNGTAVELAGVLLRFSDERLAGPGERVVLIQDGRYASETIAVARVALAREDSAETRYILAQALVLQGDLVAAVEEFCGAIAGLDADAGRQAAASEAARECARRLVGERQYAAQVEAAIAAAAERRSVAAAGAGSGGGGDALGGGE